MESVLYEAPGSVGSRNKRIERKGEGIPRKGSWTERQKEVKEEREGTLSLGCQ